MRARRFAEHLRARGLSVIETGTRAKGVPDLLVSGWGACVIPLECCRDQKQKLVSEELAFRASWAGLDVQQVGTEDEALDAVQGAYATVVSGVSRRAAALTLS